MGDELFQGIGRILSLDAEGTPISGTSQTGDELGKGVAPFRPRPADELFNDKELVKESESAYLAGNTYGFRDPVEHELSLAGVQRIDLSRDTETGIQLYIGALATRNRSRVVTPDFANDVRRASLRGRPGMILSGAMLGAFCCCAGVNTLADLAGARSVARGEGTRYWIVRTGQWRRGGRHILQASDQPGYTFTASFSLLDHLLFS